MDATEQGRIADCRNELHSLLQEEVGLYGFYVAFLKSAETFWGKLAGICQ